MTKPVKPPRPDSGAISADNTSVVQAWFCDSVTLEGEPFLLDADQARAVVDDHKNALVVARAGSGKTRVIVAKITYLVAKQGIKLSEIAAFMFNRTAAAEVNERLDKIRVDGKSLSELDNSNDPNYFDYPNDSSYSDGSNIPNLESLGSPTPLHVASTFHKFALDLVKSSGTHPKLISESDRDALIRSAFDRALGAPISSNPGSKPASAGRQRLSATDYAEQLKLTSSFITRAGQIFTGVDGIKHCATAVQDYCATEPDAHKRQLHQLALKSYQNYLESLRPPQTDFNLLMSHATDLLRCQTKLYKVSKAAPTKSAITPAEPTILANVSKLKYLLIDEYQDFSYLFFSPIDGIRQNAPDAHIFAVGDDWQAINRFAGSNVDYFINFAHYFPEDNVKIPLLTNYRSDRRIVENANNYMLSHYDPKADRAVAFSRHRGKIYRLNPDKLRFDAADLSEDGLGDGRYLKALISALAETDSPACATAPEPQDSITPEASAYTAAAYRHLVPAARLLKQVAKIVKKEHNHSIMLLHRHNFTSVAGVTLEVFETALRHFLEAEAIPHDLRFLTIHRSKGLEADVVILLEFEQDQVLGAHPHATIFSLLGDTRTAEQADQHRLIYVALTRAKHKLYILSRDQKPVA